MRNNVAYATVGLIEEEGGDMEDKIAGAIIGFVIGALADLVLVELGVPKHTAKVAGSIIGALVT